LKQVLKQILKQNRRATALLLALTLAAAAAACAPGGGGETAPGTSGQPADAPESAALKIAIVTLGSTMDGSFNEDNYNGILAFIADNPDSAVTPVQSAMPADSMNDVEGVLADYDVIVLPGFQFAAVSSLAVENPDKYFILIDSDPSPVGEQTVFANICALTFKEQESGFLAGVAAALETKSGKVAVVNGIAYPSNVNYQFGFEAGVAYANAKLGAAAAVVEIASRAGEDTAGANIGGNYIGDFGDEVTGKTVGDELIAEGADIIFVAAGNAGSGVFTAAKENGGVRVIGCDVDQYDDGVFPGGNIVLTSVLKVMAANVERALNDIAAGNFQGGNYLLGADTDSTGFVSADGRHQLSGETLANLKTAYELIKSGAIVPPDSFTETTAESFPGLE
jgi:basic membrane protein A